MEAVRVGANMEYLKTGSYLVFGAAADIFFFFRGRGVWRPGGTALSAVKVVVAVQKYLLLFVCFRVL